MYLQHWGLAQEPFCGRGAAGPFVATPVHQEALARLHFLAENHRPLGFMSGAPGVGKTLLLEVFARRLRKQGAVAWRVSLCGLDEEEALAEIAGALGDLVDLRASARWLWRRIDERLAALRFEQRACVLLLDDAEGGMGAGRRLVERLLQIEPTHEARHTLVLSGTQADLGSFGRELLERADLRIDVAPLSDAETADYVTQKLTLAGAQRRLFDFAALEELARISGGVPRRIDRLAELCLVAGAAGELATVGADVVRGVYEELRPFERSGQARYQTLGVSAGWQEGEDGL